MNRSRAMVLPIVIWCVAVAALITSSTQLGCYRQAVMGREAMSKVPARWAARAGVQTMTAILEYYGENADPASPLCVLNSLGEKSGAAPASGSFWIYPDI